MSDLPPMRPVDMHWEQPDESPVWKSVVVVAGVAVLAGASAALDIDSGWTVAVGAVVLLLAGVLVVHANRRLRTENRGRRIPLWLGSPPVRNRSIDLMNGAGASAAMIGSLMVGRALGAFRFAPILAMSSLMLIYIAMTLILHNRRVRATSGA